MRRRGASYGRATTGGRTSDKEGLGGQVNEPQKKRKSPPTPPNLCCFVVALRHRIVRAWPSDSTSLLPLLIGNARLHRFPPHPSRSRPPPAGAHHSLANRRGRVKAECQPSSWSKCHAARASRCLKLTRAKGAGSGLSANVSYRNPSLIADT
jgi:hypothetical protein